MDIPIAKYPKSARMCASMDEIKRSFRHQCYREHAAYAIGHKYLSDEFFFRNFHTPWKWITVACTILHYFSFTNIDSLINKAAAVILFAKIHFFSLLAHTPQPAHFHLNAQRVVGRNVIILVFVPLVQTAQSLNRTTYEKKSQWKIK